MGQPTSGHALVSSAEHIGGWKLTWGTETSQYLQEEKESIDFLSSGERSGKSLNHAVARQHGVVGRRCGTRKASRTVWKVRRHRVIAPYAKAARP